MCEWVTVVLWERSEGVERWGDPCTVPSEGGQRPPPQTTTAAPILTTLNKKGSLCTSGVWATQPAAGKRAPVPWALPSILASPLFLFLPAAVCSAMQNNVRQGPDPRPKPPWTNRFHLRPTFLDDALTNRVGIKPSPNNEVKRYRKRSPENRGRLALWSSAGNAGAIVLPECLDCTDTLECVRACGAVICIMVTRHSQRTCDALPFFFLRKATPAKPAPVSRHIPFPGDSGGGERVKCITLLLSFFMPSLKTAQCFQSGSQTTVLRSFPAEGNGASIQWWKVRGLMSGGGGGGRRSFRGDAGQLADQPTDCLVYDRRVQVLPSRGKRKTSLC